MHFVHIIHNSQFFMVKKQKMENFHNFFAKYLCPILNNVHDILYRTLYTLPYIRCVKMFNC